MADVKPKYRKDRAKASRAGKASRVGSLAHAKYVLGYLNLAAGDAASMRYVLQAYDRALQEAFAE